VGFLKITHAQAHPNFFHFLLLRCRLSLRLLSSRLEPIVEPVLDEVPLLLDEGVSRWLLRKFLSRRDRTDLARSLGGDTGWTRAG